MTEKVRLALDGMGGDNAPQAVIEGAALSAKKNPHLTFVIYGDEAQLAPLVQAHPSLQKNNTSIVHTEEYIAGDENPVKAIRRRGTSMRLAIESVKNGETAGVVSSGNTGAYMALSKIMLGTIPGILRPAISTIFPTIKGPIVLLDMGANLQCEKMHLAQFAVMGSVYAKEVLGVDNPTVGLLNIGSEETKGHPVLHETAKILRQTPTINFYGNVEGNDISMGTVDVVVTDGFTGNVVIKMAEGMGRFITTLLREEFGRSIITKASGLFGLPIFGKVKKRLDPSRYNGAMFIGLDGIAIKSHGGASAAGFANAINVAQKMSQHDFNQQIATGINAIPTATPDL